MCTTMCALDIVVHGHHSLSRLVCCHTQLCCYSKVKNYKEKQYGKRRPAKIRGFLRKDVYHHVHHRRSVVSKTTHKNSEYAVQSQWTTSKFRFSAHPHFVLLPSLFIWALCYLCIAHFLCKNVRTLRNIHTQIEREKERETHGNTSKQQH